MRGSTVLLAFILALFIVFSVTPLYGQEMGVRDKLVNIYVRVYRLGRMGINVSHAVDLLNGVVEHLRVGDVDGANSLLDEAEALVSRLEASSGDTIFWMNFYKYGSAALLISLPILAYLIIPRLYLMLWYRLRRRWFVRR